MKEEWNEIEASLWVSRIPEYGRDRPVLSTVYVDCWKDSPSPLGAHSTNRECIPMNLLTEPVISVNGDFRLHLPALFAAMAREEVKGFPSLRPHQRPAWHMFTVQLATLAIWKSGNSNVPDCAEEWTHLLRELTPAFTDDVPWQLIAGDSDMPAFLQPPDPGDLKWSRVETPDSLDVLISARNHDVKQSVALNSQAEDWLFALVSLQTSAGYDGRGNHGIARMNGGASSRPMLGLAPGEGQDFGVHSSRWWLRDVRQLLRIRQSGDDAPCRLGGHTLLWCLEWPEAEQLDITALDPLFIEVARRVRLFRENGRVVAKRANSGSPRIDAKVLKGNIGDPWAPVHVTERKSLTLGGGFFDYKRLTELMFGGDWKVPALAELAPGEKADGNLLVAEALARGNSKTEGFRSRVLPVPMIALKFFSTPERVSETSKQMMLEIEEFDQALRDGIALLAAGGEQDRIDKKHFSLSSAARRRFDQKVDRLFFPHLWKRLSAVQSNSEEVAKSQFLQELHEAANTELECSIPGIPCATVRRPKAEARCRRRFRSRLNRMWVTLREADTDQVEANAQIKTSPR